MDAPRTSFALIIAALLTGTALAAPPSESAPVRNDWSSAASSAAATISKSATDRYASPFTTSTQQTMTQQFQNGVNDTTNALRSGFDSTVRTAGQQMSNAATSASQQAFGTAGYPSQSTNPFTTSTQPATSSTSSSTRGVSPPPWTTGSSLPAPPTSGSNSSAPITPVDRSLLTNSTSSQSSGGWTSIGSSIAAPPMVVPALTTTSSGFAPLNTSSTSSFESGPALTTDSFRGSMPSSSTSSSWDQPSSASSASRTTAATDTFGSPWGTSTSNNNGIGASIGNAANNTSRTSPPRESDFASSPRNGSSMPDVRNTAKPTDSWAEDTWSRNSTSSQNGLGASIGASKTAAIGSAPTNQAQNGAPSLGPPTNASAGNNMNFNGANSNTSQPPMTGNVSRSTQVAGANGEPQPWVTLLVVILGLAGSLAGNVYLGWSYLDARQKYQALVRRTADTFRRTKSVAA